MVLKTPLALHYSKIFVHRCEAICLAPRGPIDLSTATYHRTPRTVVQSLSAIVGTGPSQQRQPTSRPPMRPPVGFGQGCICLLQFSDQLSNENPSKHQLSFWNSWVKESFTPEASVKFTLWMDKKKVEARPIQISVFHLPRFFLVTAQCGVKSMTLSFDGAQETLYPHSHAVVKCDRAVWTYKYTNGYVVTLSGPLTVHVVLCPRTNQTPTPLQRFPWSLKFDHFQFESVMHAKFYSTSNPNGGPSQRWAEEENQGEPQTLIPDVSTAADLVNSFGIPVATMRCLQLIDGMNDMSELMEFASKNKLSPMDALTEFAKNLRERRHPQWIWRF